MTAQNTRTQQKNGNVLACLGSEIFVKMCHNKAVWFGSGFLGSFFLDIKEANCNYIKKCLFTFRFINFNFVLI